MIEIEASVWKLLASITIFIVCLIVYRIFFTKGDQALSIKTNKLIIGLVVAALFVVSLKYFLTSGNPVENPAGNVTGGLISIFGGLLSLGYVLFQSFKKPK